MLLRREGWSNNAKVIYRLYRHYLEENLGVTRWKRRKRTAGIRVIPEAAVRANQRWSMGFVTYRLEKGGPSAS